MILNSAPPGKVTSIFSAPTTDQSGRQQSDRLHGYSLFKKAPFLQGFATL